ncbi:hypothetical protein NIES2119_27695 [[Phormidium ambiguum] IAM M-71]|uniref:PEP-CTERM protein-sorting domain-containing protein n=1 Tax=[Phormidium ambiguum] IAM M-71 TaxID=454136 RepID=A0A1U7I6E1_9CYAN|nr:PEP-CTERM sorting domain-containing protein [Phormidium ambiguum]OKH31888.1 hypothetical protein NIES2119_27695 [Phormidium ambiguum IAM M-71]
MKNAFSTIIGSSLLAASVSISSSLIASPARAMQFGFDNRTTNNTGNVLTGESQLFLDITDAMGGESGSATQALFKFSNVGPNASSITQIYFDDLDSNPFLKGITSISDSGAGVAFAVPNKIGNLPGGNNFDEDFSIEPTGATAPNGVNPGEWVSVLFNLNPGKTLSDVFSAMTSGALRVGFHVQAFANGGSEAFVNKPTAIVPPAPPVVQEPAPPVVQEPAPPVVQEPAPPVVQEPAPPVVQEPAPPVVQEPAPPVVQEPAPPVVQEPAPPVVQEPAPPVVQAPPAQPEVKSVPEPTSVGALLLAGFTALGLGKKRRENEQ